MNLVEDHQLKGIPKKACNPFGLRHVKGFGCRSQDIKLLRYGDSTHELSNLKSRPISNGPRLLLDKKASRHQKQALWTESAYQLGRDQCLPCTGWQDNDRIPRCQNRFDDPFLVTSQLHQGREGALSSGTVEPEMPGCIMVSPRL